MVEDCAFSHIYYNFVGESKSQMASKSHYWFKSYSNIAELVNFAYWWSCIGKGLHKACVAGLSTGNYTVHYTLHITTSN